MLTPDRFEATALHRACRYGGPDASVVSWLCGGELDAADVGTELHAAMIDVEPSAAASVCLSSQDLARPFRPSWRLLLAPTSHEYLAHHSAMRNGHVKVS